jgi:hypothetical protein
MRSIFAQAPFGHRDLSGPSGPAWGRPVVLRGGALAYGLVRGDLTAPPDLSGRSPAALGQVFTADDVKGLDNLIDEGLKDVPPEALGNFQDRKKQCQDLIEKGGLVGLATGGKCLDDLYNDIRKAMKHPPAPKAPAPAVPYAAPSEPFPIVPVLLAVAGGAALVFGATKL